MRKLMYHSLAISRSFQVSNLQILMIKKTQLNGYVCALKSTYHGPGVLPFGQFVEQSQEVDAGEEVPPAELAIVSSFLK